MTTEQRRLFADDEAPWEADDRDQQLLAAVVFPDGPQQPFDYRVGQQLSGRVQPGCRVRVPFGQGNRHKVGYCVQVGYTADAPRRLKDVAAVVDDAPLLRPEMLRLTEWIAGRYLCPWGSVLEAVIPAGVRAEAGTRRVLLLHVPESVRSRLAELELPAKQTEALQLLADSPQPLRPAALAERAGCTLAPINALRKKGLIAAASRRVRQAAPQRPPEPRELHLQLNADQQQALDAVLGPLEAGQHETVLLHGITGSGKTEVYIQAIEHVLQFRRQAIVLVPEISLTPQTTQRFRARFGEVAVLHSHLSDAERHAHWRRISRGEVGVIVGARSAVFAPAPQLGLVVLDEEHESTFKQETAPRYHAREVALERARAAQVPLVLGSATPSLETFHRATEGEFRYVRMPRRIFDRPLPHVSTIDLRSEFLDRRSRGAISRPLRLAMEQALGAGGQVILLLNRRGYSTHIQCPACGEVARCPECDIALTHHRHGEIALCHYCEYQIPTPTKCAECGFAGIRFGGLGTQRLEAEVRARFPDHACLRMDTDAMKRHGSHEQALSAFRRGDVRILLGTQMIAKGLDFPDVTLVGVVNADTGLHMPDFRAAERAFQLVVQVAGRTGRGDRGGHVVVQSFCPEHPAIVAAQHHDYRAFAAAELPLRKALGYPPYASLVRLVVRGPVEASARAVAEEFGRRLQRETEAAGVAARVLGPAPCPMPKLRGNYRFQLQAQAPDGAALRAAVQAATAGVPLPERVQWIVDVDPLDML